MQTEGSRNTYGVPVVAPIKVNYLIMLPTGQVTDLKGDAADRVAAMEAMGLDLENGRWAFAQQHSYYSYWQVCGSDGDMQAAMRKHLSEQLKARPCDIR